MIQTTIHHLTIEFMINFKMILPNREWSIKSINYHVNKSRLVEHSL